MDLSLLPQLALDLLVEHISEEDVLHCSMVSVGWREAFNRDHYWKPFCIRYPDSLFDYLKDKPCQVEPGFFVCVGGSSTLAEPCEWKMNYMRARRLEWNREHGSYKVHEIKGLKRHFTKKFIVNGSSGDVVFLYRDDRRCELWNVEHEPFLWARFKPTSPVQSYPWSLLHLTKNRQMLAILQRNVLEVFKLSGADFILDYTRLVDKPEELSHWIAEPSSYEIYERFMDHTDLNARANNNLFVVVYIDDAWQVLLCVWNLETGKKERHVQLSDTDFTFIHPYICKLHVSFKPNAETIVVGVNCRNSFNQPECVFKYNLFSGEKLYFPNFKGLLYIINESLVVTVKHDDRGRPIQETNFVDISTDNPTVVKYLCDMRCVYCDIHESYFMIYTSQYNLVVTNIHTKALDTVGSFKISPMYCDLLDKIDIFHDNILLFTTMCGTLQVWNWKKQIELYRFSTIEGIPCTCFKNEYFTHMFLEKLIESDDTLYIYHFW